MIKRKTVPTFSKVCECCEEDYETKKEDSRFCKESCRVNNHQKQKREGESKTPKGFICPKCNAPDLYNPAAPTETKHKLIRCGICHSEWGLNPPIIYSKQEDLAFQVF